MDQTPETPTAATAPTTWYEQVLNRLDPDKLPGTLGDFDCEPEWVKNVTRELAQACAPGFQFAKARQVTPNFVGRVLGQNCANLYAIGDRLPGVVFTPEGIERAEKIIETLAAKRQEVGVASVLQSFEFAGEMMESLDESAVTQFEAGLHAAFREALDQPNYSETVQFFSGFAQGLAKPGISAKGLARNTTATTIYFKLFLHRAEIKKLHTVPELREFLIGSGIPEGMLGQPKRLEKICERIKLSLAKRGRPSTAEKSDTPGT